MTMFTDDERTDLYLAVHDLTEALYTLSALSDVIYADVLINGRNEHRACSLMQRAINTVRSELYVIDSIVRDDNAYMVAFEHVDPPGDYSPLLYLAYQQFQRDLKTDPQPWMTSLAGRIPDDARMTALEWLDLRRKAKRDEASLWGDTDEDRRRMARVYLGLEDLEGNPVPNPTGIPVADINAPADDGHDGSTPD
jgi:hypothetical protein